MTVLDAAVPATGTFMPDMSVAPSYTLAVWIIVSSVLAGGLSLAYLPMAAGVAVCGLVLFYAWATMWLHALQKHATALVGIRCDSDGGTLSYQLKRGQWIVGSVMQGGLISRWLTIVHLQDLSEVGRKRCLVLLPDALSADNFRRLRVYLRWARREPIN